MTDHNKNREDIELRDARISELYRERSHWMEQTLAAESRIASLEALVRELAGGVRRMTYTDAAGRLLIGLVEDSDVSSYVGAALSHPIVSELTGEKE